MSATGAPRPIPLFIFGVARSGTSYTHHLLNAHPLVRLSYEGRLVREGEYYYQRAADRDQSDGFHRLLENFCAVEADERQNRWLVERMRERERDLFAFHRSHGSYSALIERIHLSRADLRCWGSKLLRLEVLPELRRHWPDLRSVILVRDPRAVYASQRLLWGARIRYSALYWTLHSAQARAIEPDPDRTLILRYEDLVLYPEKHLETLFRFAGVWDPAQVRAIWAKMPPHPSSLDKWKEQLSAGQLRTLESLCFDEMRAWGYVPLHATAPRKLGLLARAFETIMENRSSLRWDPGYWRRKQILRRFLRTIWR